MGRSGAAWTRTQHSAAGMKTWRIDGVQNVTNNINAALLEMKERSAAGLLMAATYVLEDADKTPPTVPVDLGILRSGTFATPHKTPVTKDPYVLLGYKSNYAAAVHEMMQSPSGKPINWTRVGSGPKWFESSLKRNTNEILRIVGNTVKL